MCIACFLKESDWDYWQLLKDEKLKEGNIQDSLLKILSKYLDEYGPQFQYELLHQLGNFILNPPRRRPGVISEEIVLAYYFEEMILVPDRLEPHNISTIRFEDALEKYIPHDYDDLAFNIEEPQLYSKFDISHPSTNRYTFEGYDLHYVGEKSLEKFIVALPKERIRQIKITIPTLKSRQSPHSYFEE